MPRPPADAPTPELLHALTARFEYLRAYARSLDGEREERGEALFPSALPVAAVVAVAAPRVVRFVRALAGKYAAALLRDPVLPWRITLRPELGAPWPTPGDDGRDAAHAQSLPRSAWSDRAALWTLRHTTQRDPGAFPVEERGEYLATHHVQGETWSRVEVWANTWPDDVKVSTVAELLRATGDAGAAAVADALRGRRYYTRRDYSGDGPPDPRRAAPGALPRMDAREHEAHTRAVLELGRSSGHVVQAREFPGVAPSYEDPRFGLVVRVADLCALPLDGPNARRAADAVLRELEGAWPVVSVAHVEDAIARLRAEQRDARLVPLPAGAQSRVPFAMLARSNTYAARELQPARGTARTTGYRVAWDGRPREEQLALFAPLDGDDRALVWRAIVGELGAEALRDYVILHRMAAEHGRTGRFRWAWSAHRRATAHARRVSSSSATDDEERLATIARIRDLSRLELHHETREGAAVRWKVVGEQPLLREVGGEALGGRIEGLTLVLNPALYRGASVEARAPYFTQLPGAALELPGPAFAVAVGLAFLWRVRRDHGGVVDAGAEQLRAWVEGTDDARRRVARSTEQLRRCLRAAALALGAPVEQLSPERWRVTPPPAWVAAVVDGCPPELPAAVAVDRPTTGAELRAWREREELSQRHAATALGVSFRSVQRAEQRSVSPLPRSFARVAWHTSPRA
jgi:hypothetical protein